MPYAPPALFVAWRNPVSRRIFPVGRLLRLVGAFSGYEFVYIKGLYVAAESSFEPFIAFPEPEKIYRSRELLPFFRNRVLSPSRPDYPTYIGELALDTASAEPMTLLALTGGRRTTDLVEIFPDWVRSGGSMRTRFLVRGVRYVEGAEQRVKSLRANEPLRCVPDPANPVNSRAVQLHTEDGVPIGFLPDYLTEDIGKLAKAAVFPEVHVLRVNPPPAPHHHRILCSISLPINELVEGFRGDTFLPVPPGAVNIEDVSSGQSKIVVLAG